MSPTQTNGIALSNGTIDYIPEYGRRLLPVLVDDNARTDPTRVFGSVPTSDNFSSALKDIDMATFARGVDRLAWWLEEQLGKAVDFPSIAYIGPSDFRYYLLILAAIKTQYRIMLPAPRNSIDGMLNLLDTTKCQALLRASSTEVEYIQSRRDVKVIIVPEFDECLHEGEDTVPKYPYKKTFEEAQFDPVIVLHTSGSTGLPKPIVLKHGGLCTIDAQQLTKPLDGYEVQWVALKRCNRIFSAFPPFHVAGMIGSLLIPLFMDLPMIFPPAGRPMSSDLINDLLDNIQVEACSLAPSILEEICASPQMLKKLEAIKHLIYGGGPLAPRAGDIISKRTNLYSVIGSTEVMSIPIFMHDREDWAYFHFNPRMKGIELRERGDGLSELVLVRDPEVDKYHSAWYTFPDDEEYSMQDCYAKHPTKPNYWLFMGRADDIIVLSNGETFNPKTMEDTIREDPNVREVLVLGQSRFEIAALIEQHNESYSSSSPSPDGLKRLFEYIAKANAEAPGHAQLSEDRILFTKPNKPLLRAGKGTVLRSAALKAFESEIEELYTSGSEQDTKSLLKMDAQDEHSLTDWLLHVFRSAIHVEGLTVDDDLFDAGLDSLEVMKLVRQLKVAFSNSKSIEVPATLVTPSAIYTNPTVSQLSRTLYCTGSKETDITNGVEGDHVPSMEDMYEKYAHDLPQKAYRTTKSTDDEFTVLLTGSTGSLGSYMLDSLISESAVARIYCLNRTINGEAKQKEVNAARHLSTSWGEKVKFLHVDLSKDHFDLGQVEYDELISSVSFIIHSQWSVDFNQSLNSFEPHIRGVRHLVDFSNESTMDAPILYTSSISTIGRWDVHHSGQRVPEGPTHDYSLPLNMGYGESKYVCEQLLETARDKSGVSAAICRVGQIAGPVEKLGIWNTQEWFPSIIASSKYLGLLPDSFGAHDDITWIPVDTLANIIVELMLSHSHTCGPSRADAWSAFHNLINPNSASWSSLLPVVKDRLGKDVEVVSYASWLKALQESVDRVEDIKSNPAVKLLAFFESLQEGSAMPEMETKQTVKASETMAALGPVTADWMEKWMQQWGL